MTIADDHGPSGSEAPETPPPPGEDYVPPSLTVYGDLTSIALAIGPRGKNDHGSGARKTGFS